MPRTYDTLTEAWDFKEDPNPHRLYYTCPHCGNEVDQSKENFHYWCSHCGRNATQQVEPITLPIPSAEWASQSVRLDDGQWHRVYIRADYGVEMRCGKRIATDQPIEHAIYPTSFADDDLYCATCFYVPSAG